MWNLASTATNGAFASQVHPLSLTIVVGKNVNSSIRSLEWEKSHLAVDYNDRSM